MPADFGEKMATAFRAQGNLRTNERKKVLMTGTLLTPRGSQKVTIRDISVTGVRVSATVPIPDDCDAIFRRGSIFAAARVAWSSDNEAGLRFYRDLTADELGSTFHRVIGRSTL